MQIQSSFLAVFALVVTLVFQARPAACQESAGGSKEKAKKYFERGVVLFNAGDHEGALENFLGSYEVRPHEKLKLNIGICLYKLGRYAEAGNALEAFMLKEGKNSPEGMVEKAIDFLDKIKARAGIIQVEVDEEGVRVEIDGVSFGESPIPVGIYVEPGEHEVSVEAKDGRQWSGAAKVGAGKTKVVSVMLAAGKAEKKEADMEKEVEEKKEVEVKEEAEVKEDVKKKEAAAPVRGKAGKVFFYTSLALAAATALGGAIGGGVAMQKAGKLDDLDKNCEAGGCDNDGALYAAYLDEAQDVYREGENAGKASTGLFITAGVFAAASLASLFAWKPWTMERAAGSGFKLLPAGKGGLVFTFDF